MKAKHEIDSCTDIRQNAGTEDGGSKKVWREYKRMDGRMAEEDVL